jgi:hypothetical protein
MFDILVPDRPDTIQALEEIERKILWLAALVVPEDGAYVSGSVA